MKHKHYDFIVAWAGGAKIQWKNDLHDWRDIGDPAWINSYEYRIKPEPKPDIEESVLASYGVDGLVIFNRAIPRNLKITFDGETGKLKSAEVIK